MTNDPKVLAILARIEAQAALIEGMKAANESAKLRKFGFVPYNIRGFADAAAQLELLAKELDDYTAALERSRE